MDETGGAAQGHVVLPIVCQKLLHQCGEIIGGGSCGEVDQGAVKLGILVVGDTRQADGRCHRRASHGLAGHDAGGACGDDEESRRALVCYGRDPLQERQEVLGIRTTDGIGAIDRGIQGAQVDDAVTGAGVHGFHEPRQVLTVASPHLPSAAAFLEGVADRHARYFGGAAGPQTLGGCFSDTALVHEHEPAPRRARHYGRLSRFPDEVIEPLIDVVNTAALRGRDAPAGQAPHLHERLSVNTGKGEIALDGAGGSVRDHAVAPETTGQLPVQPHLVDVHGQVQGLSSSGPPSRMASRAWKQASSRVGCKW